VLLTRCIASPRSRQARPQGTATPAAASTPAARRGQAAAAQAICRTLRGGLLEAVLCACAMDARSAAELTQSIAVGAEEALCDSDVATILLALRCFASGTQTGAARVAAAGLLPHAVVLLRSPDPKVAGSAVGLCLDAAAKDAAAKAALAQEPSTVPALLALLRGAPCCRDALGITVPAAAVALLSVMARPDDSAPAAAGRTGGSPGVAGGSAVAAAVVAGGGVARIVELLRAALGGVVMDVSSSRRLLAALSTFASTHPAAAAAARAAGAVPLAARAVVAAQQTYGAAKPVLFEGLVVQNHPSESPLASKGLRGRQRGWTCTSTRPTRFAAAPPLAAPAASRLATAAAALGGAAVGARRRRRRPPGY
jgi:hypothetical protein